MNNTNTAPVQSRGEATRTDILQVARQLFSKHGYHRTGIADIQEATGLTKGAFYHHFHSKEDLALAVLERTRQEYAEQLFAPAMKQHTAAERLEALLDQAAELNNRPEWCNCQMLATLTAELTPADGRLREAVQDIYDDLQDRCRKLLREARDAGHTSDQVDPDTGAQWIANTLTGLSLAKKLGIARVPATNLIDAMKRTLIKRSGRVKGQASGNGESSKSQPRTIPGGRSDA
ncbi:MAG TPA: TetR/AcrR family transcriptional regulator [Phycisphaerae bacterium]|nr:TetR/AcrR family transcriptional regulator [Phycisphaerae bacterium]HRR84367.1 TetR/AcrR family transcriptional regulator [Phycisphaerae bacterium]